jgi:hypothetical protein
VQEVVELVRVERHNTFTPLNDVTDSDKLATLTADLADRGWHGPPIVVDGETAYTGSHRLAAIAALWRSEGIRVGIPYVQISDLCDLHGVDWSALREEFGGDAYAAAAELRFLLPRPVVDWLGYDVDGAL